MPVAGECPATVVVACMVVVVEWWVIVHLWQGGACTLLIPRLLRPEAAGYPR